MKKVSYLSKENINDLLLELHNPVSLFLSAPTIAYPLNAETLNKVLLKNMNYMIEEDGKLVSFLSIGQNLVLQFFLTRKIYQGKGKAKELLKKVLKYHSELYCYVHSLKREHEALILSVGFKKTAESNFFAFEGKNEKFLLYCYKRV
jgi:hypothetical protein